MAIDQKIKVGIVGGTGYTGVELLRLLSGHPHIELKAIASRSEEGTQVADFFPSLRKHTKLAFCLPDDPVLKQCDVVFFATPHGVAMSHVPALLDAGVKVIDLGADFRLKDPVVFEDWYGLPHACPDLLQEAVYGLPEIHREKIKTARLVGAAGCYPTAVQLGFAPLLATGNQYIQTHSLIADVKSGISGAGRKAELGLLLAESSDNFRAYSVDQHRHHPEICQGLDGMLQQQSSKSSKGTHEAAHVSEHGVTSSHEKVSLVFVPHLLPTIRGIHATLYAQILPQALEIDFQKVFEEFYQEEFFVDVMPKGSMPETRSVRGSNYLRIAVHRPRSNPTTLVILVVEDNLTKGAAGQAIQCMNLMYGLPETQGLTQVPLMP